MTSTKIEVTRRSIIATVKVIGFHRWKDAPYGVAYLTARHRHEFVIKVEVDVKHGDRYTEFHGLQSHIGNVLSTEFTWSNNGGVRLFEFGDRSCEDIAEVLGRGLHGDGVEVRAVECWEDGENGGRVEFTRS